MKKWLLLCAAVVVSTSCSKSDAPPEPDEILGTFVIVSDTYSFYIDYGADSGVIGVMLERPEEPPVYFPFYCSTYRGIPDVRIDVWVNAAEDQIWVRSSWEGYEDLAFHRVGSDLCITSYGENGPILVPTPQSFGSGVGAKQPALPEFHVKNVLAVTHTN